MVWLPYLLLGPTAAVAFPFRLPFMAQKPLGAPPTTPPTSPSPECHTLVSPPPPVPSSWDCNVLAWVRSPDLVPSTIVPADVRISANGVGCKDIVEWSVGLVFKERASSKLKCVVWAVVWPRAPANNHADLPTMPLRYRGRGTKISTTRLRQTPSQICWVAPRRSGRIPSAKPWRRIVSDLSSWPWLLMLAADQELQSPSRWKLEGFERPVFDTNLTLVISPASWLDDEWLDSTSSFSVVMPNTNVSMGT